jgi:hypothetical protein
VSIIHPVGHVLASTSDAIGRISAGLLGVLFVVWGVWRLRQYLNHYYPRKPR